MDIHTWTTQGDTLREFAKDKKVLEIGCWKGASTINMAQVAKEVWAIDNFINLWTDEKDIEQQFRDNVEKSGLADKINLWVDDSNEVLRFLDGIAARFDFIFVDGGHESPVVNNDSLYACELINPGGYIAWHDADYPPVAAAIEQVKAKYPLTKVREDGMLHIYQMAV